MAGEAEVISEIQREYIHQLVRDGKRFDGRGFDDYRPVRIQTGLIQQAEGSARVHLGSTDVVAGVKLAIGVPYPDSPDVGTLTTSAELVPMASPTFETGPPRPESIELARVVDRGIRESKMIDFKQLCITPTEKVWVCYLDMHVVDYDGNLFDACSLAGVSALMTAKVPYSKQHLGEDKPMPIKTIPIMTTAMKIGSGIVFDPSLIEDQVGGPRLSVSTDEDGQIRAMQKGLNGSLTKSDVLEIVRRGRTLAASLRETVYKETGVAPLR
ncbi:MAG: exosome complex protein Rrp42 [Thermoplasmatota archaeon]